MKFGKIIVVVLVFSVLFVGCIMDKKEIKVYLK